VFRGDILNIPVDNTTKINTVNKKVFQMYNDLCSWEMRCASLVRKLGSYPTGEHPLDAYWRSLICNCRGTGFNPSGIGNEDIPPSEWRDMWLTRFEYLETMRFFLGLGVTLPRLPPYVPFFLRVCFVGLGHYYLHDFHWLITVVLETLVLAVTGPLVNLLTGWIRFILGAWHIRANLKKFKHLEQQGNAFENLMMVRMGRKFCTTEKRYMGWVPFAAESGDLLCTFVASRMLFAVCKSRNGFRLLGDAYVHRMMDGEALKTPGLNPGWIEFE
jgi:hypothetical protein